MNLQRSILLFAFLHLLVSFRANAQNFYFSSTGHQLWKFDVDTQSATLVGPMVDQANQSHFMSDIACDYNGQLYGTAYDSGIGANGLFKIDRNTGFVTLVGPSNDGTGLTFSPDGTLWGVGDFNNNGESLYVINSQNVAESYVGPIGESVSGDIAYNPVTNQAYYSSNSYNTNHLMHVDLQTGATQDRGDFGVSGVYGMDFIGSTGKILAVTSAGQMIQMNPVGNNFVPTNLSSTIPGGCTGGTKYHCTSHSLIATNGKDLNEFDLKCGDQIQIDGSNSKDVVKYTWKIIGPDSSGVNQSVTLQSTGAPGVLDLKNDPQFSVFQFNQTSNNQTRDITVSLTTWCDTYEKPSVDKVVIHLNPFMLKWKINPQSLANQVDPETYTYSYWTQTNFLDDGTEKWASGQWYLNQNGFGSGKNVKKDWNIQDVDQYDVTYLVHHTNGCISQDTKKLKIVDDGLYVPNAFSPNGDGLNDVFYPVIDNNSYIRDLELTIFNRNGNQIFHASGTKPSWDGTYQGSIVETGVYSYVLKVRSLSGAERIQDGRITVLP